MSNAVAGVIDAPLADGRTLKLCFDFNAFVEIEERIGLKPDEVMARLADPENPLTLRQQRVFFHAGLLKYQPEISEKEAGEVLVEAAEALKRAATAAMPTAEEVDEDAAEDPPAKAQRGTGTSS